MNWKCGTQAREHKSGMPALMNAQDNWPPHLNPSGAVPALYYGRVAFYHGSEASSEASHSWRHPGTLPAPASQSPREDVLSNSAIACEPCCFPLATLKPAAPSFALAASGALPTEHVRWPGPVYLKFQFTAHVYGCFSMFLPRVGLHGYLWDMGRRCDDAYGLSQRNGFIGFCEARNDHCRPWLT